MGAEAMETSRAPTSEELETPHRSLLGAALNLEYGPCSVAAAELAKAAQAYASKFKEDRDLFENDAINPTVKNVLVVTDMNTPHVQALQERHFFHTVLRKDRRGYESYFKENLPNSVVQNINQTREMRMVEVHTGKRFGKRTKLEEKEVVVNKPSDIWLADRIANGRVLMPIATFQLRADGNCSYVQLGPEINDDSIFAVQSDEETKRLELIDGLRALFPRGGSPTLTPEVQEFIHAERERNAKHINIALGAALGEEFTEKSNNFKKASCAVLYDNETVHFDNATRYNLRTNIGESGIDLSVFKVGKQQKCFIAGIVARSYTVLPIIEIFPSTGESRFIPTGISDVDKYKCLMALMQIIDNPRFEEDDEYSPVTGANVYGAANYILQTLSIPSRLQEQLQPECELQERLARSLGKKAIGLTYEGEVHDINMNTTTASVVGNVAVSRVGDILQARVMAKPVALSEMPLSQIATFAYDPTGPLGEQLPAGKDAEEFAELIDGFDAPSNG